MSFTFSSLLLAMLFAVAYVASKESPCGDWTSLTDQKCYKILDSTLRTFEDALISCISLGNSSTLLTIHSEEEQSLLAKFIFESNSSPDNAWLGVKFNSNQSSSSLKWIDGSEFNYTNWNPKRINEKSVSRKKCVEMSSSYQGKWLDVSCDKRNLVVCQKPIEIEQRTLPGNVHCPSLNKVRQQLEEMKQTIQNTLIPIGFLYTQLPGEKAASDIWPTMQWTEVSDNFSGLFFRVLGNQTAAFGVEQAENAPRLSQVRQVFRPAARMDHNQFVELTPNEWTPRITLSCVGNCGTNGADYMRFFTSGGEVRPRNKAVRIWKRTA